MDALFCQITNGSAGDPAPLPFSAFTSEGRERTDLAGQHAAGQLSVADLADMGLWRATLTEEPFDPETETPTDLVKTLNKRSRIVACVRGRRALTPEEIAARRPAPAVLGKVEFITLAQMAGGMTDDMLVDAHANPLFAAFWIKLQMASVVQRDYPTTPAALDALAAAGYLPEGKDAVLAAWPTASMAPSTLPPPAP